MVQSDPGAPNVMRTGAVAGPAPGPALGVPLGPTSGLVFATGPTPSPAPPAVPVPVLGASPPH